MDNQVVGKYTIAFVLVRDWTCIPVFFVFAHYVLAQGTGASAIFSLLASKLNGWSMVATEVDSTSIDYALANVKRNDMEQSIDGKLEAGCGLRELS